MKLKNSSRVILGLLTLLCSTQSMAEWHKSTRPIMGTLIRVELWHPQAQQGQQALDAVMAEMERINQLMSPYIETSELSLINREADKRAVKISTEMLELLERSHYFSELTGGAFDITYASIGRYYNFRKKQRPDDKLINKTLKKINYRHVVLNAKKQTVRFAVNDVYIDLGGIAKGHAVDRSVAILKSRGIKHAIVTAGGDSRIIGDKRGRPWVLGIRDPRKARTIIGTLPLVDSAISTSGDYERYFVEDGKHYHHILNPGTGKSALKLRSVTVIGPDATSTDGLSTSLFVLGAEAGLALINKLPDFEAVLVTPGNRLLYSNGMIKGK